MSSSILGGGGGGGYTIGKREKWPEKVGRKIKMK